VSNSLFVCIVICNVRWWTKPIKYDSKCDTPPSKPYKIARIPF